MERKMSSKSEEEQAVWSTVVPNTDRPDRGNIRRAHDPQTHPELGVRGCRTLYECFRRGATLNPLGPCMGFRAVSTTGFATPYIYTSYSECIARVDAFSAGLDTLKLVESTSDNMVLLCLFMKSCMEWILAEQAIYSLGGATVPLFDTLGPDAVHFILDQTGGQTVVCTRAEVETLVHIKESFPNLRFANVIVVDGVTPETAARCEKVGLQVLSYARVEAVGAHRLATQGHKHRPPESNDVATFCYTSGTTGDPKGALLSHLNLISAMAGIKVCPDLEVEIYDRHLSYLPLAHIFERVVISQMFLSGASVAFFRGDPLLLIEDLQACRPTILAAVPRVLNKIYDKIMAGIDAAGGLKKMLFDAALAAKTEGLQHGRLSHPLYDRLIFNKIKKGLGMDHLRAMVSGSAPLGENVMIFFRCVLGVPVVEGYGQTEGAACATIGHPDDLKTAGHVGGPNAACEVVLVDVPEMGYFHTDRHHRGHPCFGRGEICVRGPNIFKGYYKDEEKTRETIDEEGWLHSGDVGMWRPDGSLQIIDRKKNLFKLSQGEYVAPEKIENVLGRSPLIAQCFVYGDSLQSTVVAIIVPDEEPVRNWAKSVPDLDPTMSIKQLCQTAALREAILKDIEKISIEQSLHGYETVRAIFIEPDHFTVQNDLMTPTFKLKRQQIRDRYEKEIEKLYAELHLHHARSRL